MTSHDHEHLHSEEHDNCVRAINSLQSFLHKEMTEKDADAIREHLQACDSCLETFDIENAISKLIKRCQPQVSASSALRMRIMSVTTITTTITEK